MEIKNLVIGFFIILNMVGFIYMTIWFFREKIEEKKSRGAQYDGWEKELWP